MESFMRESERWDVPFWEVDELEMHVSDGLGRISPPDLMGSFDRPRRRVWFFPGRPEHRGL